MTDELNQETLYEGLGEACEAARKSAELAHAAEARAAQEAAQASKSDARAQTAAAQAEDAERAAAGASAKAQAAAISADAADSRASASANRAEGSAEAARSAADDASKQAAAASADAQDAAAASAKAAAAANAAEKAVGSADQVAADANRAANRAKAAQDAAEKASTAAQAADDAVGRMAAISANAVQQAGVAAQSAQQSAQYASAAQEAAALSAAQTTKLVENMDTFVADVNHERTEMRRMIEEVATRPIFGQSAAQDRPLATLGDSKESPALVRSEGLTSSAASSAPVAMATNDAMAAPASSPMVLESPLQGADGTPAPAPIDEDKGAIYPVEGLEMVKLGRQGESGTQVVQIDVSGWENDNMEGAAYALAVIRPGESVAYLPEVETADGLITWPITAADTAIHGYGFAEVRAVLGEKVRKSPIFRTRIEGSLEGSENAPVAPPDWVQQVIDSANVADGARAAAQEAINAANTATQKATAAQSAAAAAESAKQSAAAAADKVSHAESAAVQATTAAAQANEAAQAANQLAGRVNDLAADVQRIDWKTGVKKYIIRWDKTTKQCTRLGDAAAITTDVTHFAHRGSIDPDYLNPFDTLYPWSHRKLCKVDRAQYKAISEAGGDIMGAITMWEDEPGFGLGSSAPGMDMVYTPAFWRTAWEDDNYVYAGVADGEVQGWEKRPATVGARYHASMDADGNLTSCAGDIAKRFTAFSTLHANAKAQRMTIDDIYTWCDDTILMVVEYVTMNTQDAVGQGVCSLYREDETGHPLEDAAGANSVILPTAYKSYAIPGAVLDIGTSKGGGNVATRKVAGVADHTDAAYCVVSFEGEPVDILSTHYCAIHGMSNTPDAEIGSKSGYIGTNGRSIAYYRGRIAFGNFWRYVLGAYRQTGTGHIWTASSRAEANDADALDTAKHTDTGCALPTSEGYISTLHILPEHPLAPFCESVGGSSNTPVGDYVYVPDLTAGNTILLAGASANYGASVGRFYGYWGYSAAVAGWSSAVLLFLISPEGD